MALRDYKKGKYLLENRPGQLLPIGNVKDPMSLKAADHQQRHVLYKVWNMVEKSMEELRKVLISQLQDSNRSVEEQEKTLECVFMALALFSATDSWLSIYSRVLSELQLSDDPVWMYFDSHHKHILDQITNVYQSSVGTIEGKPEGESFSHSANGKDSDQEKNKYQCDQDVRGVGRYAPNGPPGCRCRIRRAKTREYFW